MNKTQSSHNSNSNSNSEDAKSGTALQRLSQLSTIAADTGDAAAIKKYGVTDLTTNPSLVLKYARTDSLDELAAGLQANIKTIPTKNTERAEHVYAMLGVNAMRAVPGRVSIEVPAHLSFHADGNYVGGMKLAELVDTYGKPFGIDRSRLLVKLACTWEGLEAAKKLQANGVMCNLTLVFSLVQAIAAVQAGIFVISPFVGRLSDYEKKHGQAPVKAPVNVANETGVQLVQQAAQYASSYKKTKDANFVGTRVLAASFRNVQQVLAVAGCPIITLSLPLLEELHSTSASSMPYNSFLDTPMEQSRIVDEYLLRLFPGDMYVSRREELRTSLLEADVHGTSTDVTGVMQAQFLLLLARDVAAHSLLFSGIEQFDSDYMRLLKFI